MPSYNHCALMGNLTRDPELISRGGHEHVEVGLAINRKFRSKRSEEMETEVAYLELEIWGKATAFVMQYLKKGSNVFVDGSLKFSAWEDKATGQKRSTVKVNVRSIMQTNFRKSEEPREPQEQPEYANDDIPFEG